MSSDSRKINLIIKDKKFEIEFIEDLDLLNEKIISILEKEYNKKMPRSNNLFKLYYVDEESDKNFIKSKSDYNYFVNDPSENIYVDINEFSINQIDSSENDTDIIKNSTTKENELILFKKIDELSQINLEKNKIYLEKIKILEEDKKLKMEKEKSILQCLAQEKKEKNELLQELEESKKLNDSMSITINNLSTIAKDDEDGPKDILLKNLKSEKTLLENQLNEEREKMNLIEKIYNEDNQKMQKKLEQLNNEFILQKQKMNEKNDLIIKNEIEKGINDYINKSKIEMLNKENEINNIKNSYENNLNKIREECYEEIEQKFSKIYEEKLKEIHESILNNSKILCDQIISQNQKQFEEEEKKRNQVIDANIFNNAHDNFNINPIYKCKTIHNGVQCNYCKRNPIVGYRYKCMDCPDYNLCQICEKVVEHEHNFIRYVSEEKK